MDAITTLIDTGVENPYATYPSVPRTASINGFADRIYDQLPECAKACMYESTGSTPCPYWDTGCLCVMPQFGGAIGQCVADNCQGEAIGSVEYLATSICSSAGVWEPYWFIPESVSEALASAAAAVVVEAETTTAATTEEEAGPTTDAQEGPSVDDGVSQPTETGSVEEGEGQEEVDNSEGGEEEGEGEDDGGEGEETEENEGESVEDGEKDQGTKDEEEEGEHSAGEANDSDESTSNEEGEVTDTAEAEEEVNDEHAQNEVSTSLESSDYNIGTQAEAASIASELDNGAVTHGVAIGGVIAALAALI